jgi:hypothetical protein
MKKLLSAFVLLGMAGTASAAAKSNAGATGAAFLKIGVGARAAALGGAYTALADDASAVAWNPAGLAAVKQAQATAMRAQWLQGTESNFLAGAVPTSVGTFALGVRSFSVDGLERRTADTAANEGTFDSRDDAYTLGYGIAIGRFGLGAGLTYIRQTLDGAAASAPAGDLGATWKTADKLTLGLAARNLGGDIKFDREGDPLPRVVSLGAALSAAHDRWRLAADLREAQDNGFSYALGTEVVSPLSKNLSAALRGGYDSVAADAPGGTAGVALGGGLTWKNWTVDMAWAPYGDLGQTFRYAFLVKF